MQIYTDRACALFFAGEKPFPLFLFFDPRSSSLATDLLSSSNATRHNAYKYASALAALSVRPNEIELSMALAAPGVHNSKLSFAD